MTSTFPMTTPAARGALKWLSGQINRPFLTNILKSDVLYFRFERDGKDRLVIGVANQTAADVIRRHEAEVSRALIEGYRAQGGLDLQEIVVEVE